ncbi:hypothetical protein CTEN210_17166 [Chaetoceros tenuissimus]|uniref:Elongation factor Ts, mitochondrial n=1 Tax=Chaetoceros tenuissimus TaxID=426638 RepID=A0AAD3DC83_9STRA|nr:hypothetical protein CTEN210_17166 [Chaetoceros tenuissimus]
MFQRTAVRKFLGLAPSRTTQFIQNISRQNAQAWSTSLSNNSLSVRNFSSLPKLIQQLRKATGAPMMECKKALAATENDYDAATEWLRKNGSAKAASKLAGRDASEGMVGIAIGGNNASIVRVASETDFASRSKDFTNLVEIIASASLEQKDGDDLMTVEVSGKTVKDSLDDAILAIRENLQIALTEKIVASSDDSVISGYVHGKVFNESNSGTAAAIVELCPTSADSGLSREEIDEIGKKLAMHIVAAKPSYMAPEDVPADEIEKEKSILLEQMADSGKPADILEKIVGGRMRKYYEGVCLTEQGHMLEEGNPKVAKDLASKGLNLVAYKSSSI